MGRRTIVVGDDTITRIERHETFVAFRPDVYLMGDILTDPSYRTIMEEVDGVMTITANKVKEETQNVSSKNKKRKEATGRRNKGSYHPQG